MIIILNFKTSFPLVQSSTFVHFNMKSYRSDNNEKNYHFPNRTHRSIISRNGQYKDVYKTPIETPQCTRIFKANCCLNVHSVHLGFANFEIS